MNRIELSFSPTEYKEENKISWLTLYESKLGYKGIYNRAAVDYAGKFTIVRKENITDFTIRYKTYTHNPKYVKISSLYFRLQHVFYIFHTHFDQYCNCAP